MELKKNTFMINNVIKSGSHDISADGDIIVPDTKPDILKILQLSGNSSITNREITDGKLTIDGRVDFTILYIPDTESQRVTSISSFFDFTHCITDEKIENGCYVGLDCELSRIDFQLINSRKLRIKSRSCLSFEIGTPETVEIATDTDGNDNPQILKQHLCVLSAIDKKQCDFSVNEKVELPPGHSSITNLLRCDVSISDKEFKCINGRIISKGAFRVNVLFTDTEGLIRFADYQLPFTEIFEVEGIDENSICEVEYTTGDVIAKAAEDNDGDMRNIELEILAFANISAYEKLETDYICDCYCPGYDTQLEKNDKKIDKLCCISSSNQNIRDTISPSKSHPIEGIYNVLPEIVITDTKVSKDKTNIEGKLLCCLIYTTASEESPICSEKKEIPFSISADTPGSTEKMICDINTEISHISYSINSSGDAEIRAVLSAELKISEPAEIAFINDVTISPLSETDKKGIVLYFVQPGDTIWSISKSYHAAEEDIISLNKIEGNELLPGTKLVIPAV